ncbi:hypothetical protein FB451DRAFT_1570509 [Mycena latifolia]|nr:hypothetical protein FB451DRAFT_1570509 [Mycena latifolia]
MESMSNTVVPRPVIPDISHTDALPNRIPRNLTPAQDKAFKQVMRHQEHPDLPIDAPLAHWFNRYMPPNPAAHPVHYYDELRANLVTRKARVDTLMALHARGEKHTQQWPRLCQAAEQAQKACIAATTKHRLDIEAH